MNDWRDMMTAALRGRTAADATTSRRQPAPGRLPAALAAALPGALKEATRAGTEWLRRAAPGAKALTGALPDTWQLPASFSNPLRGAHPAPARTAPGSFAEHVHAGPAGSRPYFLYVPQRLPPGPRPLLLMLHGCTQDPEDFAAGTAMNLLAEQHGVLVAYPGQTQAGNCQRCWNWFSRADQERGRGEPAVMAGIVAEVSAAHAVDPARVYVAGLSAGGAAAAVLGRAYPDLFAAVGIHSGLPAGAAADTPSALSAMRTGAHAAPLGRDEPPVIVFHGDADSVVNPLNGAAIAAAAGGSGWREERREGQVPEGRAWTCTLHRDPQGVARLEHWVVRGAGHAWSGGDPAGSYTDPTGPDASREMLRFFLERRHA